MGSGVPVAAGSVAGVAARAAGVMISTPMLLPPLPGAAVAAGVAMTSPVEAGDCIAVADGVELPAERPERRERLQASGGIGCGGGGRRRGERLGVPGLSAAL